MNERVSQQKEHQKVIVTKNDKQIWPLQILQ